MALRSACSQPLREINLAATPVLLLLPADPECWSRGAPPHGARVPHPLTQSTLSPRGGPFTPPPRLNSHAGVHGSFHPYPVASASAGAGGQASTDRTLPSVILMCGQG